MKYLIMFIGFLVICACDYASADCNKAYATVGAGYKFKESTKITVGGIDYEVDAQSPYSARLELGIECGNITYGVAHHSQWLTGAPFNDKREYSKTEIFIDYTFYWDI
jgi:hypothetical protein